MKFGVDLTIFGAYSDPALLLDLALEAEAAGWDGFFLWDHLVTTLDSSVTDPWVVLAAVAARTTSIRLGPMVTPLARRRMTKLSRETVALDHLSDGRLILGVGLGEHDQLEFTAFGDAGGGFDYQMSPSEMAEAIGFVTQERRGDGPYDVVHAGLLSGDRTRDLELTRRYAEVGVTWWLEHIYPGRFSPAETRSRIRMGPPGTGQGTAR
jgi:alkanesulfonate monooxygenase SsuD/methylene tetrahydromethanopterin reductase-like flavin-dependent oxidoreductase (luciferase family)